MINWKELEKFIAPGKVVTLVIMVDGKEISALSFNVDTLAYKEILESVSKVDTIAERIHIPDKTPAQPASTGKGKTKGKPIEKAEPVIEDDNDESPFIDKDTGEVIESVETKVKAKIEDKPKNLTISNAAPERMTRDQIMAENESAEVRANEHSGSKSLENDGQPDSANKVVEQTFGEDW